MPGFDVVLAELSADSRLSYSAHPTAHQILADVVAELVAEHAGKADKPVRVWAAHRVGMLEVDDPAQANNFLLIVPHK